MASQEIGIFEAKTNLSQIIEKVENGTDFIITKRGKPVAKIIPIGQENKMTRKEAVEKMIELRKNYQAEPGSFDINEVIDDGRR
jgi:prevent-host-death family protein